MKIKYLLIICFILAIKNSFAQNNIEGLDEYYLKTFLFENAILNPLEKDSKAIFETVQFDNIANEDVLKLKVRAPFNLSFMGFKYGNQNGIVINSSIQTTEGNVDIISHAITLEEFKEFYNYMKNEVSAQVNKTNYLTIKDKFFIEFEDNKAYESTVTSIRTYKVWFIIEPTTTVDGVVYTQKSLRYHKLKEKQIDDVYENVTKYFEKETE